MNRRLCLLVLVALIAFATPAPVAAKDPMSVVPAGVVGVVRIDYARDNFSGTISGLAESLMDEPLRATVKQMRDTFGFSPLEREFMTNFVTTTLVVFEPLIDPKKPSAPAEERVGVLVEVKDIDLFHKYLDKIRAGAKADSKTFRVSTYDKAKFPIEVFEMAAAAGSEGEPETLYTAFFGNLFAIGVGKATGVAVLETLQGTAAGNIQTIERDPAFTRLVKIHPPQATVWSFVNGDAIVKESKRMGGEPVDFVDAAGFSLHYAKGRLKGDGVFLFKKDAKSPIADYLKQEPIALTSPALLPGDLLAYTAFRFAPTKEMAAEAAMQMLFGQLNGMLGIDTEKDVLPWLGREHFFALGDYQLKPQPPFPAPRLLFGMKVTDAKACRDAMEKIEAAYKLRTGVSFEGTAEAGLGYRQIVVPTGGMVEDFSLCWLVHDDFLLLGSGRGAVADLVRVKEKKAPALKEEKLFADLVGPYTGKTLFTTYINGARLADFMVKFMEMQNTPEAEMRDVRLTRVLTGLGIGMSQEGEALRIHADLAIDKDLLFKAAQEPDENTD